MKIVIDSKIPFIKGVLEKYAEIYYFPAEKINSVSVENADGLVIRSVTKCNKELLGGSKIKFIATATIGFDHIDVNYCRKNGIEWENASGCNSTGVQQYTINSIIYISKKYNLDLKKLTLGVVGVGNIGSKVVKSAKELGMNILMNDPPREKNENNNSFVDLEYIMKYSDIISFHVPLIFDGNKTFHLVDYDFLNKLQKKPFIINTSRGEVVDNIALLEAINQNKIQKPILDVWENEPYINEALARKVLIATPHIAGYSVEGKAKCSINAILQLANFFQFNINKQEIEKLILPSKKNIILKCDEEDKVKVLETLLEDTYSVKKDHELLLINISNFEKFRSEYKYRHDYTGYKIQLNNCSKTMNGKIENFGFEII